MLLHNPPDGFLELHLATGLNLRVISADVNKNLYFCAGELIVIAVFTKPTVMVVINHESRSSVYRAFELNQLKILGCVKLNQGSFLM